jgi:molybdopterin synthase catalytic subunit
MDKMKNQATIRKKQEYKKGNQQYMKKEEGKNTLRG